MSSNNVSRIKERLGIIDVVSAYIKLDKAGINLKGKCPFHNEKTPSFFVSPDRGTYKCFGCGAGGDIFTFVEQFEGVDFVGALKILAEKAGVELEKEDPRTRNERNRLFSIMEETTFFFEKILENNLKALEYLKDRGLETKTIKKFRIGFVENEWRSLYDFLKAKKFNDDEIEKAGLIKRKEGSSGFYDRFRGRIIFPIFDNSGRVIAFSGRLFENSFKDEEVIQAKYINSPETVLFNKSKILYGYNFAKNDIRKRDFSVLVEGQMDIVMSHQAGFTNTIATSGTALTSDHLLLLDRLSNKIAVAFDGDEAGLKAANKVAKMALSIGMEVKLVEIPEDSDPADLIEKDKSKWIESLKNSVHVIDFNLNSLLRKESDKRKLGLKIKEIVLPLVFGLKSKIEQDYFVSQISLKTGISEDVIWEDLRESPEDTKRSEKKFFDGNNITQTSKKKKATREISGILYWQKSINESVLDIKNEEERLKKIVGEDIFNKIENLSKEIINEIIFEVENLYSESNNLQDKLDELFNNLEKENLQEERDKLIRSKEDGEDYLKKVDEISRKIEKLN